MKKTLAASPMIICVLYIFLPLCIVIRLIFGYDFVLYSYPVSIVALASISFVATMFLFLSKISLNKANSIFSALLLPLSAINGLCFIFCDWKSTIIFILVCCGCSTAIFAKFARPIVLKNVTAVLSALLMFLLFIVFIFKDFGSNTVVKSVASPQNTYVAEVIDSDQGALGGDTFVTVQNKSKSTNLFIGKFSKAPVCVYAGEWGEYMQIQWEDEHTLIINGKKYYTND